jgi:hypothetical protein
VGNTGCVTALRVDVVFPHVYKGDFTCAVYSLVLSLFISCLSALPSFFTDSFVIPDVCSLVIIVQKLISAHQGQQRRPKGVGVQVERRINAT